MSSYNRRKSSRKRSHKKMILICCEGEKTEYNYFESLRKDDNFKKVFSIKVRKGEGGSPDQIVKRAIKHKNKSGVPDEAWCVMDTETFTQGEMRNKLEKSIRKLKKEKFIPCLSNPAFEVWILAHFKRTTKSFFKCDNVIEELNKEWKKTFKKEYDKSDPAIYKNTIDKIKAAIGNAKWIFEESPEHSGKESVLDCNSSTEIYKLIEKLTLQL